MASHRCLYLPPVGAPRPSPGDELDLGKDEFSEQMPTLIMQSVLGNLASGPWPPTLVSITIDRVEGRIAARVIGMAQPEEVFGPRVNEVSARIETITGAPWFHPTLRNAELEGSLQPFVDEYARRMRRFGKYPYPRVHVMTSFSELRYAVTGVPFPAAIAEARIRENHSRGAGAKIAMLTVTMRIVSKLVPPLFSAATTDVFLNADASAVEAFKSAGVAPAIGASLIHEALSPLSSELGHLVNWLLANDQQVESHGFFIPPNRIANLLIGCLRMIFSEKKHTADEIRCVLVATFIAWHRVSNLLTGLTYLASQHIASLVMRPPGTLDPWGPLFDLMEMGVMVVGHTDPTRFSIFTRTLN